MRCSSLILLLFLVLVSGKVSDASAHSEVRLIGQQIFSSIHKQGTLSDWPTDEIKALAGPDAWGDWKPTEGMIGTPLKIWHEGMALVKIDGHYAVMGITSLEMGTFSTGAIVREKLAEFSDLCSAVMEEMAHLWQEDKFPIYGMVFKFTHLMLAYFVVLVLFLIVTWHLTPTRSQSANIVEIRAEMGRIYKEHNPSKAKEIDSILQKWKGREMLIVPALRKKYDCQ
jgi:hypothetical protein